jgi:hypothetical protein
MKKQKKMEKMKKLKKKMEAEHDKGCCKMLDNLAKKLPAEIVLVLGICGIGKVKKPVDSRPISYKKLRKHIGKKHPVNPLTLEKFKPTDSICVYNYGLKMIDACFCIAIYQLCKRIHRKGN